MVGHWKADVSGEDAQSQELFGSLLISVHAAMFLAIIVQSYLAMQVQYHLLPPTLSIGVLAHPLD